MQEINFIQSTNLGATTQEIGLFELFLHSLQQHEGGIFTSLTVIVPNLSLANWLNDRIAEVKSICCNIEFTLLNHFIETIYLNNNPQVELFKFQQQAAFIIYDYLCTHDLTGEEFSVIYSYLFTEKGEFDHYKAFQLALQLQAIFHEYMYLRTTEFIDLKLNNKLMPWQKQIWQHLFATIGQGKTYLDIYKFFKSNVAFLNLPRNLYIFGLTSIYPSQLEILQQLAKSCSITWYYLAISNHYYGDLLSNMAQTKLQQKMLSSPNLHFADLYLTSGNLMVANWALQSREFNELLLANGIFAKQFELEKPAVPNEQTSLLNLLKHDIREILHRSPSQDYLKNNLNYYAKPICLKNGLDSVKFNICYNKMREVQVLFNELFIYLSQNPKLGLNDILITALDIDAYAPYIDAIFNNEYGKNEKGQAIKIPFMLTGNKAKRLNKIIDTFKFMLKMPYHLPVNYVIELLGHTTIMQNLQLSLNDLTTINTWLQENKVHFGFDATDYAIYQYQDFDINSFKRFLINLTLGMCMPKEIALEQQKLPLYTVGNTSYAFYDNLENNQLELANKLIKLIQLLVEIRNIFYLKPNFYAKVTLLQAITLLELLKQELVSIDEDLLLVDALIGHLKQINLTTTINLPILSQIIEEYCASFITKVNFSGKLTCASMQAVRNIPYKVVYILGMNFGHFPRSYTPNKLSILAQDWAIADRNLNAEDKQTFLDLLLATQDKLYISYIGRSEYDNQELEPSPMVSLLMDSIKNSLINGKECLNAIVELHSLHPFYNNKMPNYSAFWGQLSGFITDEIKDKRWDFSQPCSISLTLEQNHIWHTIKLTNLINTFLYSNQNLYAVLGLNQSIKPIILKDYEDLELINREVNKSCYKELQALKPNLNQGDLNKLKNYFSTKGILAYGHMGEYQFKTVLSLYNSYLKLQGQEVLTVEFYSNEYKLAIKDEVLAIKNDLIICEDFGLIKANKEKMHDYKISLNLKIKCLIYKLLAQFANFTDKNLVKVVINKVYLRLISLEGQVLNYEVHLAKDPNVLWNDILQFYLESLIKPVLIHKKALEEYISAKEQEKVAKAYKALGQKYKNKELEQLKLDPIFSSQIQNYLLQQNLASANTLIQAGEILRSFRLVKVEGII